MYSCNVSCIVFVNTATLHIVPIIVAGGKLGQAECNKENLRAFTPTKSVESTKMTRKTQH